jgi:hypothetical protein
LSRGDHAAVSSWCDGWISDGCFGRRDE